MSFTGLNLPNITDETFRSEKSMKEIKDYLYQLTEQLRYVLNNLDEENFSESFKEEIGNSKTIQALTQKVEDTEKNAASSRRQTAELISQTVKKDGIISAINQSSEIIQILANKIALEGYVTINGTLTIDEDGYLRCSGGTLGDFTVDEGGGLFGTVLRVGNMTMQGNKISGLKLTKENVGIPTYTAGELYPLFLNKASGDIVAADYEIQKVGDMELELGQYGTSLTYDLVPMPIGYVVPPVVQKSGIQISAGINRMNGRAAPSMTADTVWTVTGGEIYSYNGTVSTTFSDGYTWAYCNTRHVLNYSTGTYTAQSVTPFYVRSTTDAGAAAFSEIMI
jgi:hypothetical protein